MKLNQAVNPESESLASMYKLGWESFPELLKSMGGKNLLSVLKFMAWWKCYYINLERRGNEEGGETYFKYKTMCKRLGIVSINSRLY